MLRTGKRTIRQKEFAAVSSPALDMGDSFFGRYATNEDGSLCHGRLYLGVCANGYGSVLTTLVELFFCSIQTLAF